MFGTTSSDVTFYKILIYVAVEFARIRKQYLKKAFAW